MEKELKIVSIEYKNDEESKNNLIKLIIDCLLNNTLGGEDSNNGELNADE